MDYLEKLSSAFEDELKKIANNVVAAKVLVPVAAGMVLHSLLSQANRDRQMGRQLRVQQQGF